MSGIPMTSSIDNLPLKTNTNQKLTDSNEDVIVSEIIDYVKDNEIQSQQPTQQQPLQHPPQQNPPQPPQQPISSKKSFIDYDLGILTVAMVIGIIIIQDTDILKRIIEYFNIDISNTMYIQYGMIFVVLYVIQKNNVFDK